MQRPFQRLDPRPPGTGPFVDYVRTTMRHEAVRTQAARRRWIAASRRTSAEQRWEGEGGSMRERAPGGRS